MFDLLFLQDYVQLMESLADVAGLIPPYVLANHAEAPENGPRAMHSVLRSSDTGASDANEEVNIPVSAESVLIESVLAKATCEDCLREVQKMGLRKLEEWLWSGPLLPCNYRIRQHLAFGSCVGAAKNLSCLAAQDACLAFRGAVAETREVNSTLEDGKEFST